MEYLAYRGEHGAESDGDLLSRGGSLTFSENLITASLYARHPNNLNDVPVCPRVLWSRIRIDKPFGDPDDPFVDIKTIASLVGINRARYYAIKYDRYVYRTNNWQENFSEYRFVDDVPDDKLGDIYLDIYPLLDDPEFVAELKALGYDGALHGGMGDSSLEVEYRVFDPGQVTILGTYYV